MISRVARSTNWLRPSCEDNLPSISAGTHCRFDAFLCQQTELWNDALEERIECCRKTGETISAYDQYKSLMKIRGEYEEFSRVHAQCQRSVLFRLDRAFKAFFRRVKAGGKPGFPRFKGQGRQIRSFDVPQPKVKDGSLRIKGIGRFRIDAEEGLQVKAAHVVMSALREMRMQTLNASECEGICLQRLWFCHGSRCQCCTEHSPARNIAGRMGIWFIEFSRYVRECGKFRCRRVVGAGHRTVCDG